MNEKDIKKQIDDEVNKHSFIIINHDFQFVAVISRNKNVIKAFRKISYQFGEPYSFIEGIPLNE